MPWSQWAKWARQPSLKGGSAHPPQTHGKVQSAVSCAFQGCVGSRREALIGFNRAADHPRRCLFDRAYRSSLTASRTHDGWCFHHLEAARPPFDPLAGMACPDRVHVRRAGLGNRLGSHPEADQSRLHRIVVVLSRPLLKSVHIFTKASFSGDTTDWKPLRAAICPVSWPASALSIGTLADGGP